MLLFYSIGWLGFRIKQIIDGTIKFHQNKHEIFIEGKVVPYLDNVEQRNVVLIMFWTRWKG